LNDSHGCKLREGLHWLDRVVYGSRELTWTEPIIWPQIQVRKRTTEEMNRNGLLPQMFAPEAVTAQVSVFPM
jgi:hypothetical protein